MLERLRGKRLVYVGDSLNRNMWESLVCTLRNSVKDKRKVFEASGREEFRTEGSYSFVFEVVFSSQLMALLVLHDPYGDHGGDLFVSLGLQLLRGVLPLAISGSGVGDANKERGEKGDASARHCRAIIFQVQRCRCHHLQHRALVDS